VRDILFTIIFTIVISQVFRRPWIGILIWSWLSYMNPHRLTYGFAYLFPWVAITAGVTIACWVASGERKWFPWTRETILEIVFTVWFTVTTIFALNAQVAWDYWDRAFKVQIMILMTLLIIRTRFQINALVWTIAGSMGFFGLKGGLWSLLTGGINRVYGPPKSFIEDNNALAVALVMVLPLMRYLQLRADNKFLRLGLIAAQVLTALAVLTTYSRAGFIALCVVGSYLWWKSRHKVAFALALVLVAAPLIRFMPETWKERMSTIQNTDDESLDASARGRLNAWAFAINLVEERPILGGGFRVFISPEFAKYAPDPKDRHDAHSIYFEVLGEHGFPGLFLFLALGVSTWFTAQGVIRRAKDLPQVEWAVDLVRMLQVSLAGFAAGGAFAGLAFFDLPYHLVAIVVLCKILVDQEIRAMREHEVAAPLTYLRPVSA